MTKWRPENWNPKITSKPFKGLCSDECLLWAFETGADAMLEARDKWLQEQCREKSPCIGCDIQEDGCREVIGMCSKWFRWKGQQEGYALGLAKLWEMVDYIEILFVPNSHREWRDHIVQEVKCYLKARGVERT
jgi:hypothetical protein